MIATESEEADKVKSVVSLEEAAASKEAAGVKAIKVCNDLPNLHLFPLYPSITQP